MNELMNCASTAITDAVFDTAIASYSNATSGICHLNYIIAAEQSEIYERYEATLSTLQQQQQEAFEQIKTYCLQRKQTLFGKRRSMHTAAGTLGFRLGTPKLKPMDGTTWNDILPLLKERLPDYVRTTEEPAKDALLQQRHQYEVASQLQPIGLQVVQDEVFYIEPLKSKSTT
jgi:phage host-nuclease inhibitor protein Gam